ncbi:efflux RND transporter periplasmic adaptor subunit [Halomonas daqiaonensis]|uniref:RND family efflux transporter, MFP subunit n=1 Tax=Halomonas daqiaonensis TaxID=650850 RepID=A0A1H7VUI6_9GAMM|nr:efflux RND transporter periplasmic adaptor subunit [Halomonas daqiaonensis]SEM12830.1 RND family efflux transporter, MFP subunit [Halomonas daqiaonensis]
MIIIRPMRSLLALGLLLGLAAPLLAQEARVTTARIEKRVIVETIAINGSVTAPRTAHLSSDVAGRITQLPVSLGEHVQEGDLLLAIDGEEVALQAQSADADVGEARAALDNARRRLREGNRLGEGRNIASSELSQRETNVAIAEATLERRLAELDRLEVRLERHRLQAPFAGRLTHRDVAIGEWATPGTPLLTLIDLERLTLDFAVPLDLHHRLADAELEVRLPGSDDWLSAQTIAEVPLEDGSSRQFLLRATLDNPPAMLPGMAVQGRLLLRNGSGPVVPRDALIRRPDGSISVWLAREEDDEWRANEQRVTPGASHEGQVAIQQGVEAGERVVLRGNERLEEGQPLILDDE